MLINNRYQVIRPLGEGGFGHAYLAEDSQMPSKRRCVIKQLKPVTTSSEVYEVVKERFGREAATLEKLGENNSQIPRLYAYFSENQKFYLVQEWIEGPTLEALMAKQSPQPESVVRVIVRSLLSVLDFVHGQGIIHRDLKPDNVVLRAGFLPDQPQPVLIDFGAVRETMGTVMNSHHSLASSIVIGTPGYMASEQAAGRPIPSSDLYSLGLMAIYLLTGLTPQMLASDPQTGEIIWRDKAGHVSLQLVSVIDRAVRSHPRDRYSSASEMLTALTASSSFPNPSLPAANLSPASTLKTAVVSPGLLPTQTQLNTQQQQLTNSDHTVAHHDAAQSSPQNTNNRLSSQAQGSSLTPLKTGLIAAGVATALVGGGFLVSLFAGDSTLQQSTAQRSEESTPKPDQKAAKEKNNQEENKQETENADELKDFSEESSPSAVDIDSAQLESVEDDVIVADGSNVRPDNPDGAFGSGQPAVLRQDLGIEQVRIFAEPAITQEALHYGLPGDRITILDSFQKGDVGWNLVRFDSGAEGWVTDYYLTDSASVPPVAAVPANNLPRYGQLTGLAPGRKVRILELPSMTANDPHYGLVGDSVELLSSANGDDGMLWYQVGFESGATGWVRSDFLYIP